VSSARPIVFCVAVMLCVDTHAHLLNMTKVHVTGVPDGSIEVRIDADLTRAAGGGARYYEWSRNAVPLDNTAIASIVYRLAAAVIVTNDETPVVLSVERVTFPAEPIQRFTDPLAWPMSTIVLVGRGTSGASLQARLTPEFPFEEPIAITLERNARTKTRWVAAGQWSPVLPARDDTTATADEPRAWYVAASYLAFGFLHILPKGLDHILFVLGLYFGSRSMSALLWQVTAFTVAHSITLAASTLQFVAVPSTLVEPLIAASIVWIGIENAFRSELGWPRWLIVFGFGLLHGLGFAAMLSEIGLPGHSWMAALLSFNVGVELGQFAVIVLAACATMGLLGRATYRQRVAVPASLAIALVAIVWTAQRIS